MKMKEVCEKTGLTERTIRFYQQKGLLAPAARRQKDKTFYDYSESDLVRLSQIALLRRCSFSVEEIQVLFAPSPDIRQLRALLPKRLEALRCQQTQQNFQLQVLERLEHRVFSSSEDILSALEDSFQQAKACASPPPLPLGDAQPDFSKFDSETPQEKEEGYLDFLLSQRKKEKREKRLEPWKRRAKVLAATGAALLAAFLLSCIPHSISRQLEGVIFIPGTAFCETRTVTVEGKLTSRLFFHPVFSGYIRIEGIPYTLDNQVTVDFQGGMENHGWLIYSETVHQNGETVPALHSLGLIYTGKKFDSLVLDMRFFEAAQQLFDTGGSSGPVLCAPAESYEQAVSLAKSRIHQPPLGEEAGYFGG